MKHEQRTATPQYQTSFSSFFSLKTKSLDAAKTVLAPPLASLAFFSEKIYPFCKPLSLQGSLTQRNFSEYSLKCKLPCFLSKLNA